MWYNVGSRVRWSLIKPDAFIPSENGGVGTIAGISGETVTIEVMHMGTGDLRRLSYLLSEVRIAPLAENA